MDDNNENVASLEVAAERIRCKEDLYNSLLRNKFFLPPKKDPFNTVYFMQGVFNGDYWCFNSSDVKALFPVADPPSRELLATILATQMHALKHTRPLE